MPNTTEVPRGDAVFDALGSGSFQLFFIDREEVGEWIRAATAHGFAAAVVGAVDQFLRGLQRPRPASKAPLCFTCDAGFGRGALPPIVGLIVSAAEPSNAAGLGFCRACADRAGWHSSGWQRRLVELGLPQFRKMWADFRIRGRPVRYRCRDRLSVAGRKRVMADDKLQRHPGRDHHARLLPPAISVITSTGIGDHLQPEWLITFTGMRSASRGSGRLRPDPV
jgi:hypothetical protein